MPIGQRSPDMAGEKFGSLTLVTRIVTKNRHLTWECKCDCGKKVKRRQDYLLAKGKNHNFSCGCRHPNRANIGSKSTAWTGHGDVSGYYFAMCRWRSQRNNLEFSITIDYIWELFKKQKGLCAITKLPIKLSSSTKHPGTASLDRIDSTKGYTESNVQWLHKDVNRMKNAYSIDRFLEICYLATKHNPRPTGQ